MCLVRAPHDTAAPRRRRRQVPAFLARHPQLQLKFSSTDRMVDLVREGFDCVVRVGTLVDSSLVARPLGAFRIVSLASPAYLAAHGVPRTIADLDLHALIHYVPTLGAKSPGFEYRDGNGYATREMPGAVSVNNADAYEAACVAGLGIIQAPIAGLRDRKPLDAMHKSWVGTSSGWMVNGTPDQLINKYNSLAGHADLLPFCRHYGTARKQ